MIEEEVKIGSFVLNLDPYLVDSILTYSTPTLEVARFPRLTRPGSIISQAEYAEKVIEINGRITARGRNMAGARSLAFMQFALDELHKAFASWPYTLLPGYDDGRYYANARIIDQVEIAWQDEAKAQIGWRALVLAADPFMYGATADQETDSDALTVIGADEYAKTIIVTPGGNAAARPFYTITIPGGGPYGLSEIRVINNSYAAPEEMIVTTPFAANDVLTIDCENDAVKLNGVEMDYAGQFPLLDPTRGRTNEIIIEALATSTPTLEVVIDWTSRWRG